MVPTPPYTFLTQFDLQLALLTGCDQPIGRAAGNNPTMHFIIFERYQSHHSYVTVGDAVRIPAAPAHRAM
jgi:hypothetical protein